ncbi:hypothetical protein OAD56_02560 [Gammaproteobacteria bacterium]|nr:hypothetical protein [Gammaproteobacteria bacterium]
MSSGKPANNEKTNFRTGKLLTTEDFVKRARQIHGNKYDYTLSQYKNKDSKVKVICPVHGVFEQQAYNHSKGTGCPKCGQERRAKTTRLSTAEFIEQARAVHGTKYDYSAVEYSNGKKKVRIICSEHGSFDQAPLEHKEGKGCPKCGLDRRTRSRTLSTAEFIEQARAVHGTKYDYSAVEYSNGKKKVRIICSEHGSFEQTPHMHKQGRGCPKCGGVHTVTTASFIEKAKEVHSDKYGYALVTYLNNSTKIKIVCALHGVFEQTPNKHLLGRGCPRCKAKAQGNRRRSDVLAFIEKAKLVHGDNYGYEGVNYDGSAVEVEIRCPKHGGFQQSPNSHLRGNGCPKCSGRNKTTEMFIEEAQLIHGDSYDYSWVEYDSARSKLKILCKTHDFFEQTANDHLSGRGCPSCAVTGFNPDKPGLVYYVRVETRTHNFWKIGITNHSVKERFAGADFEKITVLKIWEFEKGVDAYIKEQEILKKYSPLRYTGIEKPLKTGNTELFIQDVLNLDPGY